MPPILPTRPTFPTLPTLPFLFGRLDGRAGVDGFGAGGRLQSGERLQG